MRLTWTISRRLATTFAAALAFCTLGPAPGVQAQEMKEVTFIVVNNLFSTPAFVAVENGYWAKQGLNVKIKLTASGRQVTQSLQAGEAQLGHAALSTTTASARASGNMLKGVMPYYNAADHIAKAGGRAIIARKDRGIDAKNPKTMEGKKIGYLKGSTNDVYVRQWFKREGLDISKSELLNVPVENMPITLSQGQVDAIVPWEPYTAQAVRELGPNAVVVSRGEASLVTDIIGVVAHENWIGKNYDLLEKFSVGIAQAAQFIRQNPKAAAEIDTRYLDGLNVADAVEALEMGVVGPAHLRVHDRRAGHDRQRHGQGRPHQDEPAVHGRGLLRRHRAQAGDGEAPAVLLRPAAAAQDAGGVQGQAELV